jgi:glycosyltransferase involved in cell wall biosynthesis
VHVLLVVSAKRYTGAAAIAEHMTRAVRAAGESAELLFLGGDNLERRLQHAAWAHPRLIKERTPWRAWRNLRTIQELARRADVVICHLPHDHLLCRVAGLDRRIVLTRSFRNPRHLRSDPYHRWVASRTSGAVLAYSAQRALLDRLGLGNLPAITVPVPLDDRFRPGLDGRAWRRELGVPETAPVVGMVGKIAPGRGFERAVDAVAHSSSKPAPHLVLVGHGELESTIAERARSAGLEDRAHFAGYQEQRLPELYAAMSVCLLTAAGSDYGHRAVSEAHGCGTPVVACPLPGIDDLITDRATGLIASASAASLAAAIDELLTAPELRLALAERALEAVAERRLEPVGRRLVDFLQSVTPANSR